MSVRKYLRPCGNFQANSLDSPVTGLNLAGATLRDQLNPDGQTLLVFLRHFGCLFCREMVADLRDLSRAMPGLPADCLFLSRHAREAQPSCASSGQRRAPSLTCPSAFTTPSA